MDLHITSYLESEVFRHATNSSLYSMPPKKKLKDSTPYGEKDDGGEVCGADKCQKIGVVSKKTALVQKKTQPELLIAAASTAAASVVDPVTPPAAASTWVRQHAVRDVLWFQQVLKANAKDVDLPNFGDTSEDEESEEEEEKCVADKQKKRRCIQKRLLRLRRQHHQSC